MASVSHKHTYINGFVNIWFSLGYVFSNSLISSVFTEQNIDGVISETILETILYTNRPVSSSWTHLDLKFLFIRKTEELTSDLSDFLDKTLRDSMPYLLSTHPQQQKIISFFKTPKKGTQFRPELNSVLVPRRRIRRPDKLYPAA